MLQFRPKFETIFQSFRAIEGTKIFILKFPKRYNYVKTICGVSILVLCTLSDDAL